MLGQLRRTTRLDVGLALVFVGLAYLTWVLVAGVARALVADMISFSGAFDPSMPPLTRAARIVFVDAGVAIDVAGLVWLVVSLLLVIGSSRQRFSISWPWLSGVLQTIVAAVGGIGVAWAVHLPYRRMATTAATTWQKVSGLSLPVLTVVAVLIWVTFLVMLLVERARFNRRGPSPRDGLRTQVDR
ncbi:MAG: hypothetical protein ABSH10_09100 [Phycisphaerae bacterium]|jgi:hypothetical protein